MLFENRNKAYGAYDLRANYENRLFKSFGIALLIAGFFFLIPFVLTQILTHNIPGDKVKEDPVYDLGQKLVFEDKKPRTQPTASRTKVIPSNTYKIVEKEELKKEEKIIDPLVTGDPVHAADSGVSSDSSSTQAQFGGHSDSSFSKPFAMASVDQIPSFPGGEEAMLKFLSKNIHYTEIAIGSNVTGRVYASFIVDEEGKITDIKIMRGLGYGLEEEVVRVLGIMPDWTPGKYQGRRVKTILNMPVFFSLK